LRYCYYCKKELKISEKPPRDSICPSCGNYLKVCLNCKFYNTDSYNQCFEPMAERVYDKEKANFCEYFHFTKKAHIDITAVNDPFEDIKRLFHEL